MEVMQEAVTAGHHLVDTVSALLNSPTMANLPLGPELTGVVTTLQALPSDPVTIAEEAASLAGAAALLVAGIESNKGGPPLELPKKYDPENIAAYYAQHPEEVRGRVAVVAAKVGVYAARVYTNVKTGNWGADVQRQRAAELKELVAELGPTYVKVAQVASMRPDLLPEPFILELQKLQDRVPPFPDEVARALIEEETGRRLSDIFEDVRAFDSPVAAASLGQVYKAQLRGGGDVAVKVQRPQMRQSVTLDLHVIRILLSYGAASPVPDVRESAEGFLGVLDNWATRFLDELDYEEEARSMDRFRRSMEECSNVRSLITAPVAYLEHTSEKVLVTEWVVGERLADLSLATQEGRDIALQACRVLLLCYLAQLLETGFLHADPHPGNFLRTPDGRVCVLDFGLMTEVTEDQRIALLEYVAHLNAGSYDDTLDDLITLGFIPPEVGADKAKRDVVVPLLGSVLGQLSEGGGAAGINVESVGKDVEELSEQYPIIIPPYFGLIVRAFSTLEGLGLQADPSFSVVKECFPYLARRLLTDDSPRVQEALKLFLYGGESQLKVERLEEFADGFRRFAEAREEGVPSFAGDGAGVAAARRAAAPRGDAGRVAGAGAGGAEDLDPALRDFIELLFSPQGNFVQDLLVDEAARAVDALSRQVAVEAWGRLAASAPAFAPLLVPRGLPGLALAPLNPVLALPAAAGFAADNRSLVTLSDEDKASLELLEFVAKALAAGQGAPAADGRGSPSAVTPQGALEALLGLNQAAQPILPVVGPGVARMTEAFARKVVGRLLARIAGDIMNASPAAAAAPATSPRLEAPADAVPAISALRGAPSGTRR